MNRTLCHTIRINRHRQMVTIETPAAQRIVVRALACGIFHRLGITNVGTCGTPADIYSSFIGGWKNNSMYKDVREISPAELLPIYSRRESQIINATATGDRNGVMIARHSSENNPPLLRISVFFDGTAYPMPSRLFPKS